MVKSTFFKSKKLPASTTEMEYKKGGEVSAAKAKEILHDGTVHGKPLTSKQRKFFGAMSTKKKTLK